LPGHVGRPSGEKVYRGSNTAVEDRVVNEKRIEVILALELSEN